MLTSVNIGTSAMKLVLICVLFSAAIESAKQRQDKAELETGIKRSPNDECVRYYTPINDADGVRNLDNSTLGYLCDSNMTAGWYRWLLRGQNAIIPTSCTPEYKCGTVTTLWIDLSGQPMPSVGRDVQGRVCGHYNSICCFNKIPSVIVRNCGSYYIYHLPPALDICYLAYCLQMLN